MEPRRSNSIQPTPTPAKDKKKDPSRVYSMSKVTSIASKIDRRTVNIVLFLGVIMMAVGVIASGLVIQPSALVDAGSDGSTDSPKTDHDGGAADDSIKNGSEPVADNGVSEEIFIPPVDWDRIYEKHALGLKDAGSYTVEKNSSWDYREPSRDHEAYAVWEFNINDSELLLESNYLYPEGRSFQYGSEGVRYSWDLPGKDGPYSSSEGYYKDEFDPRFYNTGITPSKSVLVESEFQHSETYKEESIHVYRASSVNAAPDSFLQNDKESILSFDYEIIVSEEGIIREYSYEVTFENDGSPYTRYGSVNFKDIGRTSVEEPDWVDDARAATD